LLEAAGLANLAEQRCWNGRLDEALVASAAAHQQSVRRFREQPLVVVSLYHAQLQVLAGSDDEARATLAELGAIDDADPSNALMRDAIRLALGEGGDWDALHVRAATLANGLQPVEMLWLDGRRALAAGDAERARQQLARAAATATADAPLMARAIEHELAQLQNRWSSSSNSGVLSCGAGAGSRSLSNQ
jgi:hypothetical protein